MTTSRADIETVLKAGRRRSLGGTVLWIAVGLAVIAVGSVAAGRWLLAPPPTPFVTEAAARTDLKVTVTATGTVQPTNQVDISSELSGLVAEVNVDDNDPVTKGEVLARLDTDKLRATADEAQATVAARQAMIADAEATVTQQLQTLDRANRLIGIGGVSIETQTTAQAAYDRAVATLDKAKADLASAKAQSAIAATNLERASILSPIDGVVLERVIDPGQIIASSFQTPKLFTIAEDLKKMELKVDVDEADIGEVAVGDHATFTVDAYDNRVFPAVISELGYMPRTVDGVVTYEATLTIDNSDLALRPGMTATADIIAANVPDQLVVPNSALRFTPPKPRDTGEPSLLARWIDRALARPASPTVLWRYPPEGAGQRRVWVLHDNEVTPVDVQIGLTDGTRTAITGGDLSDGDAVVTDMTTE